MEITDRHFSNTAAAPTKKRIYLIDEIRGLAVIAMVIYHFLFSASEVFHYDTAHNIFKFIMPIEPAIAVTFVFLSGICTKLSRSNLNRGFILFAAALTVNIVTAVFVPDIAIRFGVINLLSVCMILYGLCEKFLKRINPVSGFFVSIVIFTLTWGVNYRYIGLFGFKLIQLPDFLYNTSFLFPFGLRNSQFRSSDYFPIFPWFFLFLSGAFFACLFLGRNLPNNFYTVHSFLLSKAGKYSFIIYIVHQPIIFGVLYIFEYFNK